MLLSKSISINVEDISSSVAAEHFQVVSTNNTANGLIAHTVNERRKNAVSCARSVDTLAVTKEVASHFCQVHVE